MSTADLGLSGESEAALIAAGFARLAGLGDYSLPGLAGEVGMDPAAELLEALVPLAVERSRRCERDRATVWANAQVTSLGLSAEAAAALERAGVSTLAELRKAFDSGRRLTRDPKLERELWRRLSDLDRRERELLGPRRTPPASAPLKTLIAECRAGCRPEQWRLLCARFGMDEEGASIPVRRTLTDLGRELGRTGSAVKGRQERAIANLARPRGPLRAFGRTLRRLLREAGGLLSLQDLAKQVGEQLAPGPADPTAFCRLAWEATPGVAALQWGRLYALEAAPWNCYEAVITAGETLLKGHGKVAAGRFLPLVPAELGDGPEGPGGAFVEACLRADPRFRDLVR